jgi:hypothetical protein
VTLPARILIVLALLVMTFSIGWGSAIKYRNGQDAKAALEASETARETERLVQRSLTRITDAKDKELRAVGDRLADALERLRNRPARLPEAARAACEGATGAQLSGPDSDFLAREAARADRLRAELGACQDREWSNFEALKPR